MQLTRIALLLLSIVTLTPSLEAALTSAQIRQAQSSMNQMQQTLEKMRRLAIQADIALANNNTFTVDFSTVTFSLSAQQQQDIVSYYQLLKTQLQAQLDTLP